MMTKDVIAIALVCTLMLSAGCNLPSGPTTATETIVARDELPPSSIQLWQTSRSKTEDGYTIQGEVWFDVYSLNGTVEDVMICAYTENRDVLKGANLGDMKPFEQTTYEISFDRIPHFITVYHPDLPGETVIDGLVWTGDGYRQMVVTVATANQTFPYPTHDKKGAC